MEIDDTSVDHWTLEIEQWQSHGGQESLTLFWTLITEYFLDSLFNPMNGWKHSRELVEISLVMEKSCFQFRGRTLDP